MDQITEMIGAFLEFGDLDDNHIHRPPEALFYGSNRVEDLDLRRIHRILTALPPNRRLRPDQAVQDEQTLIWFAKAIWMHA